MERVYLSCVAIKYVYAFSLGCHIDTERDRQTGIGTYASTWKLIICRGYCSCSDTNHSLIKQNERKSGKAVSLEFDNNIQYFNYVNQSNDILISTDVSNLKSNVS